MADIQKRRINLDSFQQNDKKEFKTDQKKENQSSTYPTEHPVHKARQYLMEDLLGGPKLFKLNWVINLTKGLTPVFIVLMMYAYQNFSLGSFIYLAMHGSYGIIWFAKDCLFPDKTFQVKQTIYSNVLFLVALLGYWSIGWQIFSGKGIQEPSYARMTTCLMLYIFGVCIMLVSDAQKYYTLKYKDGLISEGLFAVNRNPNYFGEMLVYGSFALIAGVWQAWIPLILMWGSFFTVNMYLKDISISRKSGGSEYIKNSYLFLFKVFEEHIFNIILYSSIVVISFLEYKFGFSYKLLHHK